MQVCVLEAIAKIPKEACGVFSVKASESQILKLAQILSFSFGWLMHLCWISIRK